MSSAVGAHADEIVGRINASSAVAIDAIRGHGDGVAASLAGASSAMSGAVSDHAEEIVGRINASSARAVDAIKGHGDGVAMRLAEASAAVSSAAGAHADEVVGRIASSGARAADAIREQESAATTQFVAASLALSGAFGAHASDIVGRINTSSEQALQALRTHGDSVASRIAEVADTASSTVGAHGDALVGRIDASSAGAVEALRLHADVLAQRLVEAAEAVHSQGDSVATRLAETSLTMHAALDEHAQEIVGRIDTNRARTVEAIRTQGDSVAGRLGEAGDALARDFSERSDLLLERLDAASGAFPTPLSFMARIWSIASTTHPSGCKRRSSTAATRCAKDWKARVSAWRRFCSIAQRRPRRLSTRPLSAGASSSTRERPSCAARSSTRARLSKPLSTTSTRRIVGAMSVQAANTQSQIEQAAAESLASSTPKRSDRATLRRARERRRDPVTAGAADVHEALTTQVASFETILAGRGASLVEALADQTGRMGGNWSARRPGRRKRTQRGRSHRHPLERAERTVGRPSRRAGLHPADPPRGFRQRFGDHLEELSAKSAQRLGQFETATAANYNAIDQALTSQSRRIEASLGDGLSRFESAIDGRGRDLVARSATDRKRLQTILPPSSARSRRRWSAREAQSTKGSAVATKRPRPFTIPT